jgi:hypothetical protein
LETLGVELPQTPAEGFTKINMRIRASKKLGVAMPIKAKI